MLLYFAFGHKSAYLAKENENPLPCSNVVDVKHRGQPKQGKNPDQRNSIS